MSATRKVVIAATVTFSIASGTFTGYWEGKRNKTYLDPLGIPTSCYGHTGPEVTLGQTFTDAECEAQLEEDSKPCWDAADRYVKVPMKNYQQAALMDFCVNGGAGSLQKSPMVKYANQGDWIKACNAFVGYYETGKKRTSVRDQKTGKVTIHEERIWLPGLARRRAAESALCHGQDVELK